MYLCSGRSPRGKMVTSPGDFVLDDDTGLGAVVAGPLEVLVFDVAPDFGMGHVGPPSRHPLAQKKMVDLTDEPDLLLVLRSHTQIPGGRHREDHASLVRRIRAFLLVGRNDVEPFVGRVEIGEVVVRLVSPARVGEVVHVGVTLELERVGVTSAAVTGMKRTTGMQSQEPRYLVAVGRIGGDVEAAYAVGAPLEIAPGTDLRVHQSRAGTAAEPETPLHPCFLKVPERLTKIRTLSRGSPDVGAF